VKAIHLTGYGSPAQNLKMVEVPEPHTLQRARLL
jgi:NADPH:quinone reductase-like Zn-dependent oxidoreductase